MTLDIYSWSALVTAFTNLGISSLVYLKNREGLINKIFPLYSLSIGLWSFCWFKQITSTDSVAALNWAKALTIGSILIPAFFLHFVFVVLNLTKDKKKLLIGNYILALIFIYFCYFTNLFIKDIGPIFSFKYYIRPGPVYMVHFLSFIAITIYGGFLLWKASKKYIGLKCNQVRYLFWALLIGYSGGVTAFFPIYKLPIMPPFAIYAIPICIIIIAYTIVKYRLMDIRVAITRTGIFVVVYTLVLGLPFVLIAFGKQQLIGLLQTNWWLVPMILMAALATAGPFLYIFLQRRAESILLREQKHYQETLKQAGSEMTRIHNVQKLLDLITDTITRAVQVSHCSVYLFQVDKFILKSGRNLDKHQISLMNKDEPLIVNLEKQKEPIVYEEIKQKARENSNFAFGEVERQMQALDATVVVPSFSKGSLLAFFILGNKRSGRVYTSEDLGVFSVLASQAALAIENALLYENIEEQVRKRTAELIGVQNQLTQAAKLATVGTLAGGVAHEINNPLAAILTNAQMLLASVDEINAEEAKESLELIEEATKRCRVIVRKLMVYARKPLEVAEIFTVDLLEVAKKVNSFLGYQFKQENIDIIIESEDDRYLVMGNQNELEQVVTNIVLNAKDAIRRIKKSGRVEILLSKNNGWIRLDIKDEGFGIPKEHIPKIFDPFFTTKDVGKGLGLGLSISQSIVEKYKGSIFLKSEEGKGTAFTINFPQAG